MPKTDGRSKSRDEQVAFCRKVAEHHGIEINEHCIYVEEEGHKGEWYWDDGTSRFPAPYRPELTRLMADVAAGRIDRCRRERRHSLNRNSLAVSSAKPTHRRLPRRPRLPQALADVLEEQEQVKFPGL